MSRVPYLASRTLRGTLTRKMLLVAVLPLAIGGLVSGYLAYRAMATEVTRNLQAQVQGKGRDIENYFRERTGALTSFSMNPTVADAFGSSSGMLPPGETVLPPSVEVQEGYRSYMAFLTENAGFSALLFVSEEGEVLFSLGRSEAIGQNLFNGEVAKSLAAVKTREALEHPGIASGWTEFEIDGASPARHGSFNARPIWRDGRVIGAVVAELSPEFLVEVALDTIGLGSSGEVVLAQRVGGEVLLVAPLRSDTSAAFTPVVLWGSDSGEPIQLATAGGRGSATSMDYRGVPVVAAWSPVGSGRLGIVVKMDKAEALSPLTTLGTTILLLTLLTLVGTYYLSLQLSGTVVGPILRLRETAGTIVQGDLGAVADQSAPFEVGELARSFNQMVSALREEIQEREVQKERLDVTLASLADGVLTSNSQGRVDFMNPAAEAITGWPSREAQGRPLEEVLRVEARNGIWGPANFSSNGVIAGSPASSREIMTLVTRGGEERIITLALSPIWGTETQILGEAYAFSDITEGEQAAEEIQRKERVERSIHEVFRRGALAETSEELGAICLSVAEESTGSTFGFVGLVNGDGRFDTLAVSEPGWDQCSLPDSKKTTAIRGMEIRGVWARAILEDRSVMMESPAADTASVELPGGHPPLNRVLSVPLRRAGSVVGVITVANKREPYEPADRVALESLSSSMVEAIFRKRAEEALAQAFDELEERVQARTAELRDTARELERSNQDLQQFAYVASHDLQEPLRMVSSFTQLLARRYGDRLDDEAKEFIGFAVDGAERMQSLIRGLLDFSRVQTRGDEFKPVDLDGALDLVLMDLGPTLEERKATVRSEPLPTVNGDEGQLRRVLVNLVGNAVKFGPEEGPEIRIWAEEAGEEWQIGVRDNGSGISPEYFDRIFLIFQRLNSRARYPGSGMGLAICKRIVERHGGRIWVESEPGAGATFFFTLPNRTVNP